MTRIVSRLRNKWIGSVGDNNETLRWKTAASLYLREEIGERRIRLFPSFFRIYVNVEDSSWENSSVKLIFYFREDGNFADLSVISDFYLFLECLVLQRNCSKIYCRKILKRKRGI